MTVDDASTNSGTTAIDRPPFDDPAHAALAVSEIRYRRLFEAAQDGILLLDAATGQINDVNPYLVEMLGYSHAELLGKKIWEMGAFKDVAFNRAMFERLQATGYVRYEHLPLQAKNGATVAVEFVSNTYDCGGIRVVQCNIRNISRRVLAEAERRAAVEQVEALLEQSIAGVYIVQDGKFAFVNRYGAAVIGESSVDSVIGTDPLGWVVEADRALVAEQLRRLQAGEAKSLAFEFVALKRNGTTVEVAVHAAIATHRGRRALIGLLQDNSSRTQAARQAQKYLEELESAILGTVEVASILGEMRDPYTAGHERRVANLAVAIGAALGFDRQRLKGLHVAGALHDIGKISIPAEILTRPRKLTAIEYQIVQGHAQAGYDVLKGVAFPWPVALVALQHHERMDGSGYPQGLKGDAILLEARIMAVADVVEAMSAHRPYRAGLGIEAALAEIERARGTAYDADVADACLHLFRSKQYALPLTDAN